MRISTKGRYGLRVMIDLATHSQEKRVPLREISDRQNITVKYLEQIMTPLLRDGYIESHRGNCGGYSMKVLPTDVSVGDILRTMEGSLSPVVCLEADNNDCPRKETCQTLPLWENLDVMINNYLNSITLQQLLQGDHEACNLTKKSGEVIPNQ